MKLSLKKEILESCVSSYHLHGDFYEFRRLFVVICTGFMKLVVSTRYIHILFWYLTKEPQGPETKEEGERETKEEGGLEHLQECLIFFLLKT
jgi:hypothetical protein